MRLNKYLQLFIFLGMSTFIFAQGTPYIDVDFNDCQIQDNGIQNINFINGGAPACGCGLDGDALYFNGNDDYLVFDDDISSLLSKDFTISFYMQILNNSNTTDILSFQKECKRDSSFTLKYIPSINECRLDIAKNNARLTQVFFNLDEKKCWQHIVITRKDFEYSVYLNGIFVGSESAVVDYNFAPDARLAIGNSPCVGINEVRFKGGIESFKIYNKAINELDLPTLNLFPEQILNNDTTLVYGESIDIKMGPTCSDGFYWSPTTAMDDQYSLEPNIAPFESSTYKIIFQNGTCTGYDSINVFVLDPDELDCNNLLLPNAFSPNGDNLNETFGIDNTFLMDELITFDIYSRIGSRVFHGEDKQSTWDGNYLGDRLNPSKFAWVVRYVCKGKEYQKEGVINLIR